MVAIRGTTLVGVVGLVTAALLTTATARPLPPMFGTPKHYNAGSSAGDGVALADLNRDGELDVVLPSRGTDEVWVLLGNGDGSFDPGAGTSSGGDQPWDVTVGRFDDDAHLDVAVANDATHNVGLLLGDGTGGLSPPEMFQVGDEPRSISKGDFNADGDLDLATANFTGGSVSVLLGDGEGNFETDSYPAGTGTTALTTGRFNDDRRSDIAVTNLYADDVTVPDVVVFNSKANGTMKLPVPYKAVDGGFSRDIRAARMNDDKYADLVVANGSVSTVSVLRGRGDGTFRPARNYSTMDSSQTQGGENPQSLAIGDFDDSPAPDVVTMNFDYGGVSVLPGTRTGALRTAGTQNPDGEFLAIDAGDLDGKCTDDIVLTNFLVGGIDVARGRCVARMTMEIKKTTERVRATGTLRPKRPNQAIVIYFEHRENGVWVNDAAKKLGVSSNGEFATRFKRVDHVTCRIAAYYGGREMVGKAQAFKKFAC